MGQGKKNFKPWRLFMGIIVIGIAIAAILLAILIQQYSLARLAAIGQPTENLARAKEGHLFSLPIDFMPEFRCPLVFQSITVTDMTDSKELDLIIFTYDLEHVEDLYTTGYIMATEFLEQYGDRIHSPQNYRICSKRICVLLLFKKLPPQDHILQVKIFYRLFGIVPKNEVFELSWM